MLSLVCALAITGAGQVPTTVLPPPDASSIEGFTSIFAVHELADGRVIMTDNVDNAIRLVNLRDGSAVELGRRGRGPKEYLSVTTILRGSGDTVLVTDNVQRRFVQIADGDIAGSVVHPDVLRSLSNSSAPLADGGGRLYFDVRDIEMRDSGFYQRGGHVIRWTPGETSLDTVAFLPATSHARRANVGFNPFVFRAAWGLARNGAIAVVTADPYQVTWVANGRAIAGESITYRPVAVDGAERDAERLAFQGRGGGGLRFRGPERERPARPRADADLRRKLPDDVFPPFKPPFLESRVLVSPAGDVWIPRAGAWDSETTLIDVVGRDGRLLKRVRLPANQRVVGFGRTAIYLAERDEYDLHRLRRVAAEWSSR